MNISTPFEIQNEPGYSVIRFFGFVDAATTERIKPVINARLPGHCTRLIIDLEKVEFLDSHGIGLFASLLKKVHAGKGRLIFAGACGQPASVLHMVGFNAALVTYCENMQAARKLLEKEPA